MGEIKACGGCGARELVLLLDMGLQPVPEGSAATRRHPLRLARCTRCTLVQLDYVVPPEELFARDHPYATGNSAALREHYGNLGRHFDRELHPGDLVVDIGANDGTLLSNFSPSRKRVAVEPTDQVLKCPEGIIRCQEPWTPGLAGRLRAEHGRAQVITACNVLAHVPDVHDFLDGVTELLADDGKFVTENHDVDRILTGNQVDTVYHEHLRYYSPATLSRLLEGHGLHVGSIEPVPTHGGSFRTVSRRLGGRFPVDAKIAATALRAMLYQFTHDQRATVYGVGAATRATPLIHYAGIAGFIDRVCEVSTSDKIGGVMPGTQVPVTDERDLWERQPEYALLFNWHMAEYVIPKLRERGYKGRFIVPLPTPKVLDD